MTEVRVPDPIERRRAKRTALLLVVWFALTFGALFSARDLQFSVAGWPFHYWLAAQGGVLAFIAIVAVHAALMHGVEPDEEFEWQADGPDDE